MNPIISVLPRMLIGLVAALVYMYVPIKVKAIRIGLAAFLGTATNTILVMTGILHNLWCRICKSYTYFTRGSI